MRKQSGFSGLLAAAASFAVIGMVALGSAAPAQAASEEDLAAPQGSFVSTLAVPAEPAAIAFAATFATNHPVRIVTASEEDLAVPPGAFTSVMAAPALDGRDIRLASAGGK